MDTEQGPSAFWITGIAALLIAVGTPRARALTVGSFSSGTTTPQGNGFLYDGGGDQFDSNSQAMRVNGDAYNGGTDGAVGTLPHFTLGTQATGGVEVSGRVDLFTSNGAGALGPPGNHSLLLDDYIYARQFYTFTNPTAAPINASIDFEYTLGSQEDTLLDSSSNGDALVTAADIWTVTDDAADGGEDPAVAVLAADGLAVTPTAYSLAEESSEAYLRVHFDLTLAAGGSRSLMLFVASRNQTQTFAQPASRGQSQADIEALLADRDLLFNGLSGVQATSVANFVPEPGTLALLAMGGALLAARRH